MPRKVSDTLSVRSAVRPRWVSVSRGAIDLNFEESYKNMTKDAGSLKGGLYLGGGAERNPLEDKIAV